MTVAVQKLCKVCEKDVSASKRTKNSKGEYFCQPCVDALQRSASPNVVANFTVAATASPSPTSPTGRLQSIVKSVWRTKVGRISTVVGGILAITLTALIIIGSRIDAANRAEAYKKADESERMYNRIAASSEKRSEAAQAEADADRQKAAELRGTDSTPFAGSPQHTRSEAMQDDPVVAAFVDQFPDLKSAIKTGDGVLSPKLDSLVAGGQLSASDAIHIRRFSERVKVLPK